MLRELGLLLKYEFRFYFRFLPPLYLALILLSFILRSQGNIAEMGKPGLFLFLYFIWFAIFVAMYVITIVHIIQRFIHNFMKDQGSLMFTLPVTIWTLITSKAIAAFCMILMSTLTAFISMFVFIKGAGEEITALLTQTINLPIPDSGEIMIIVFVICANIFQTICLVYLAITVSFLLPRFRFVAGCGVYIAISSFLEQPVFNFATKNTPLNIESYLNSTFQFAFGNDFYVSLIPMGVAALAFTALYFWVTGILLQRTFNLE
jgi:hypothetical protein